MANTVGPRSGDYVALPLFPCILWCRSSQSVEEPAMAKHRNNLPQLAGGLFLTDGAIETTLVFLEGFQLPYFAAFHLMADERGRNALRDYYRRYVAIAAAHG